MIHAQVARITLLGALFTATAADADDDPAKRPTLIPGLVIKGSDKGEGTISLGVDALVYASAGASFSFIPTLDIQSNDGVATVLSLGSTGAQTNASWRAGADFTFRVDQVLEARTAVNYYKAILVCLADPVVDPTFAADLDRVLGVRPSAQPGTAGNADSPVPDRLQAAARSISYGKLCAAGKKAAVSRDADVKVPLPKRQYSIGVRVGQATLKYLKPGTLPDSLVLAEDKPWTVRVGLTKTYYSPTTRNTFEWGGTFDQSWTPAKDKVRWCVAQDPVDVDPASGAEPGAVAETCDERPGAPPTQTQALRGMIAVGRVSPEGFARAAVGLVGETSGTGKRSPFKVGFTAPVYLQYASKDYSGLVRATPTLTWNRDSDGKRGWEVSLTIALLGKRNLFPNALD